MTTKEILVKAKGLIEKHGWTQDKYHAPTGEFCSLGAIRYAIWDCLDRSSTDDVYYKAKTAFLRATDSGYSSDVAFNDAEGRTKDEVLAVFDKAIAACDDDDGGTP